MPVHGLLERIWPSLAEKRDLRSNVRRINKVLQARDYIKVSKIRDGTHAGLHWYVFAYEDQQLERRVRGSGFGFSDELAIARAWGEFVERYSFFKEIRTDATIANSNGFAAHTVYEKAKEAALAELIERDVFLCSWLLRRPAQEVEIKSVPVSQVYAVRLKQLEQLGFQTRFGLFGRCMGHYVGVSVTQSSKFSAMSTVAKPTLKLAMEHLIRESATTVSDFTSSALEPLEEITESARPIDHLRHYLNAPREGFLASLIHGQGVASEVPGFGWAISDLTKDNSFALESGYHVSRAVSEECQKLWFGPTKRETVNLARLSAFLGKEVAYESLNLAPHPLA